MKKKQLILSILVLNIANIMNASEHRKDLSKSTEKTPPFRRSESLVPQQQQSDGYSSDQEINELFQLFSKNNRASFYEERDSDSLDNHSKKNIKKLLYKIMPTISNSPLRTIQKSKDSSNTTTRSNTPVVSTLDLTKK